MICYTKDMQKITGIGGYFFRAKNPEALGQWYEENFGINSKESNEIWYQQSGPTVFAPAPHDTDFIGDTKQQAMINFRVNSLAKMITQLEENHVKIVDEREEEGIGKFASVYDPEGNKIELWEPHKEFQVKNKMTEESLRS